MVHGSLDDPRMSNDAFAGFIRLLLTPLLEMPRPSAEVDAYLDYLRQVERPDGDPGTDRRAA